VDARKKLLKAGSLIKPFIPPVVYDKAWEESETDDIINDMEYFSFRADAAWHGFPGYEDGQYYVDPNKFMLTTPGIEPETGDYSDFGVPAILLANYLRENCIVPEKNDFNSILFLMTPAATEEKMNHLIEYLLRFEEHIRDNSPLSVVLPSVYKTYKDRYEGYMIRDLCQELHDFYKKHNAKSRQNELFRCATLPESGISAYEANTALVRNNVKLVPISEITGEIALEGALPYPPGIICVAPGERWSITAQKYFMMLEEGINVFPGFAPEIQGVHFRDEDGRTKAYAYVYDQ